MVRSLHRESLMPKRRLPPTPLVAVLTPDGMQAAIPKLERRITELRGVDVSAIPARSDPQLHSLEQKIEATLTEIFGFDTVEYRRYRVGSLDTASINMLHPTPLHEIREGYKRGIDRAVSTLRTIIDLFQENLADGGGTPTSRAARAFRELRLHPEIVRATEKLFYDGHYANAVEDACKVLDSLVKMRSKRFDLGGTELMQHVFSPKAPVLSFNTLRTETDRSEQQGMMFLYSGAMLALRNPRAHELIEDDPETALEYIGFLSLLAKSLDRTT
jgi:uncharacterized protein (TIGR02391 family)